MVLSTIQTLKNISSLRELAFLLGHKPQTLSFILYKMPKQEKYRSFTIPKRGGGERKILAPCPPLKIIQRHLANLLYDCYDELSLARNKKPLSHGFRRGLSIITNAQPHDRRRYVLNLDLLDFFPSFNFGRVRGFFIRNNDFELNKTTATLLAQIACHDNFLPQGSPCSPIISDLIAHILDIRLVRLAKQYKLTYSRYVDDITFSTNQRVFPADIAVQIDSESQQWNLGNKLMKEIIRSGFNINSEKTRMQFRTNRQVVTGLVVNQKVNVPSERYRIA